MTADGVLLEVKDVLVEFASPGGSIRALDGVTLDVRAGETLAVVGESGCGKTTLARAVLGLQPISAGSISLLSEPVQRARRDIALKAGMVWQDPYASLDPRWRVGRSIVEPGRLAGRPVELERLLVDVGLEPSFAGRYPHQLSGGQRQRVAIARALALRPPLVICDEPTAALDLSIRAQILNLLRGIQDELRCAILYISHDLLTVRFLATRIAVMYLGRIVEQGPTEAVFNSPRHPYTRALLDSSPSLDRLQQIPQGTVGELPDPRTRFVGCRFASRCPRAQDVCRQQDLALFDENGRQFACHFPLAESVAAGAISTFDHPVESGDK